MAGFLSSSTTMLICESEERKQLDLEKLRNGAFTNAVDPEGRRYGWTGLEDLVDTSNFFLAGCDSRFAGFSYRLDVRKPSAAIIRLRMAEKLLEAEGDGKKLNSRARRELREKIAAVELQRSQFVPSLIDCIWDSEKGRLFLSTASEKLVELILAHFEGCFGMHVAPIGSEKNMADVFANIQNNNGMRVGAFAMQSMGSASLTAAPNSDERRAVVTLNNSEAISEALGNGLEISKMSLVAEAEAGAQYYFTLDSALAVTSLRLPKAEKGEEQEGSFIVNADICATVADLVTLLSQGS